MFEKVCSSIAIAYIITVCGSIAYGILISSLINYGSRGCFCDISQNGLQIRLLDVDVDDIILLTETDSIEIINLDGPPFSFYCFLIKLSFTLLTERVFKRKRPVMNASGDNWRVGLIES